MRKTLASLLAALMVLTLGAGTVTATGNSKTSLRACTDATKDYYGGIKVYARDKAKGASRVMCPPTADEVVVTTDRREGSGVDRNLNRRNRNRPPLEDIWNGFYKNIESFKLRAAAGCLVGVALVGPKLEFIRTNDNIDGAAPKTMRFEVPRRKDNRATTVAVGFVCPATDPV